MSTKHINANHIINIEGHSFKADDHGMWNLTEIWKTLGLPNNKLPSKWRNKVAETLKSKGQICLLQSGTITQTYGTKYSTLQYAGWVSLSFQMMVYSAFESILAMPEVQTVVANKMVELGYKAEAELLERQTNADRDYALREFNKLSNRLDGRKPERLYKAVVAGHMTKEKALSLIPVSSVWHSRLGGLD
ncbi:hypothetical protein [Proteus mirabilis]|uniref:hypothetical protein n=1 Tax=Proteus mirabilis TaxID=584 RepID=UPI001F04D35F|nr:hypothetical protein [Proteus mirabilis]